MFHVKHANMFHVKHVVEGAGHSLRERIASGAP